MRRKKLAVACVLFLAGTVMLPTRQYARNETETPVVKYEAMVNSPLFVNCFASDPGLGSTNREDYHRWAQQNEKYMPKGLSYKVFGQITRILFARGRTSATVSSSVGGMGERSYVLGARSGQTLSANVSSRNGCIMFGNTTTSLNYTTDRGDNYFNLMNRCRTASAFTLTVSIY